MKRTQDTRSAGPLFSHSVDTVPKLPPAVIMFCVEARPEMEALVDGSRGRALSHTKVGQKEGVQWTKDDAMSLAS